MVGWASGGTSRQGAQGRAGGGTSLVAPRHAADRSAGCSVDRCAGPPRPSAGSGRSAGYGYGPISGYGSGYGPISGSGCGCGCGSVR
ncbi:hypothetical protein GCM10009665_28610 [Kitasatospora nipponensis]|uniref:Uncharacterized protein n=1 Tax=Kitasatospora nipponensis TaxID=258049 RepID=A0ABP4GTM5_9ACTN